MENPFDFGWCKKKGAFKGTTKKSIKLDLSKVKEILEKEGYKIKLFLPDLIIAKKRYTLNIFNNGKILLRGTKNEEKAKEIIKKFYEKIL